MKRLIAIGTAILLALALCACGGKSDATPVKPESKSTAAAESYGGENGGADPEDAVIGVMTQEYIGDNIAEILMIDCDGDNAEIERLNGAIENGIQRMYLDFIEAQTEDSYEWIEIKSYPFTSDDYLQIVTNYIVYPTYGSRGDIESFNFNISENRYVTLEEAMSDAGLTNEIITEKAKELYTPDFPSMSVAEVEPAGFLVRDQGAMGLSAIFLLEVVVDNTDGEPWKGIFAYEPMTEGFYELDGESLFDPDDMDEMEPPLSYAMTPRLVGDGEIREGIYYSELIQLEGDPGDGLTPREGAELLVTAMLEPMGFFDAVDLSEQCVYISLDDAVFVDTMDGHECYIYSVATGTYDGGFFGDGYEVVHRVGVDYETEIIFPYYD